MKNFTNNFKQFTSRLSARWLIMALMMLVGIGELFAATTVYFVNKPNWSQVNVHQWSGGTESSWPGPKATKESDKVNGYDVYMSNIGGNKNFIFSNNGSNQTANLDISNGTWYYDGKQYSSKEAIEGAINNPHSTHTSITTFSVNSSDVIYFDATDTDWTTCYMYIGHNGYSKRFAMTREPGTKNLWKGTSFGSWNDAQAWYFSSEDWNEIANGKHDCILCKACYHTENTFLMPYKSAFTNNAIYKASANNQMYATSECYKNAWSWSSTVNTYSSSLSVSITNKVGTNNTANAGTVTVKKWDSTTSNAGSAYNTSFLSTSAATESDNTGYKTALEVTATPKTGYKLKSLTVGGTTVSSGYTFEITAATAIVATWEETCNAVAKPTITLASSPVKCGDDVTAGLITINGYDDSKYIYTLKKDGNATAIAYNNGYAIIEAGTYTVTADVSENSCGAQTSDPQKVTVTDNTHTINSFTITAASDKVCKGSSVKLSATHVNGATYAWYKGDSATPISGATDYTYSPIITENTTFKVVVTKTNNGCPATAEATSTIQVIEPAAAPALNPKSATVCGGEPFKLQNIDGVTWSLDGKPTTGSQPGIANNTDAAIIKTFQAVKEVDGCPSAPADYKVTVNPTPVITGESVAQPGKANAITLKLQGTLEATWKISGGDIDKAQGNSIKFSAETNDTYTITATTEDGCLDTHEVTVADAFYVYMRQPKKGETAYNNFYYPTQNPTQGGDLFYKEYASIPPAEGYTDYNQGGRDHDVILTDCDGYVWYGFKASAQLIAGTNYFTVHAPNKNGYDGWYTHTDITKPGKMTGDIYYIMGTEGNGNSGWKIEEASAPNSGPVVHASGSTTLGTDKFAALYVTDCSGKEITGYQWEYCRTQDEDYQLYSSVCSYTFEKKDVVKTETSDAGKSNNIRPSELGYYRCKVTYKDGTTATSATEHILGSYSRSFTSNIPVLVVNTGGKGFPDCTGLSGQTASRNASKFKAKRSVDVKIYEDGTLVYDRKARMNYRGSSSLNFVKKSYAFCPGDANCGDADKGADYVKTAKLNMLGVGTACDKDWVLYAAAADPSLMRNRLVFDSYKAMTGKWGVNSRYVELIVDGVYKGVYVFMDKITMNTERVKVDEDKGFIVKFDKTDREDRVGGLNGVIGDEKTFKTSYTGKDDIVTYDTSIDQRFEIEYPEKDDYTTGWKARVDGIQGMFQAFEDALKQGDYATVQKYIDYTSWADWFIINEFTKNVDAYRASCIFVYTGEAGAKIEARPLWDQELSFNNQASKGTSDKGSNSTTGLLIQHSNVYSDAFKAPFWFTGGGSDITGGLLSDPCFVQVVKERWNIHQFDALSKKSLEDLVDEYEDDLAPEGTTENAQTRETTFWDGKSRGKCDCSYETSNATATGYQNKTFEESKGTITNWISDDAASGAKGRRAGLTTAINGLTGASFSIQILPSEAKTTPWEPVEIAVSVTPAGYDYKLEYTDNNLGSVANTIIKEEGDKIIYRIPRPDAWGTGNESVEGERTDIEYGIKATLSVQEGTTVCGSQAAPSSTGKIILQDEPNEKCD